MNRRTLIVLTALALLTAAEPLAGQRRRENNQNRNYPPVLKGAEAEVYKTVGKTELELWRFAPDKHEPGDKRPAIVFFFGGGWRSGSPKQFEQQCRYLASRGMVAITADYRVASRHQAKVVDCVSDAKAAIAWVRTNAKRLGVDPDRIVASGGSAGGHIAACTGVVPDAEDQKVSSRPNAMVLFNPVMDLASVGEQHRKRFGAEPAAISPLAHVRKDLPPTAIYFGTDDRLLEGAKKYDTAAREHGNRCELKTWKDEKHGFFNHGRAGNKMFIATVRAMDAFLVSLGYLEGEANVEEFLAKSAKVRR